MDIDIPLLDDSVVQLPSDIRQDIAEEGKSNLFVFARICGFYDLTERCHGPVCVFWDHNAKRFKLILMPRDHLKTSLITIAGDLQLVVQNPEHRILILNETATNAAHMMRGIRQIAEGNRVFRSLYPHIVPRDVRSVRWNDSELDFARQGHYPEPTITAMGITSAVVSRHYTHITVDDVVSEEAVKSELVMQDTLNRMSGFLNLLVNPSKDTITWVGTRWALHDPYSHVMKTYGDRLGRLIRAVIEEDEIIWPERFTPDDLALMRADMGEYKFSCLMMNNPRNEDVQDLNISDLRSWGWVPGRQGERLSLFDADGQTVLDTWDIDDLAITVAVDLAPAETINSDRNAVSCVGVSPKRQVVVLDAFARRCTPDVVMEHLFDLKQRFAPRAFGIEDINYQKALKWILRTKAQERGLYLNIVPVKPGGRGKPHVRGLQPIMAAHRLFIDPSMHLLRNEMSEFPLGKHDDCVDALALQLQLMRGVMSPEARERNAQRRTAAIRRILGPRIDEDKVDADLFEPRKHTYVTREYVIK